MSRILGTAAARSRQCACVAAVAAGKRGNGARRQHPCSAVRTGGWAVALAKCPVHPCRQKHSHCASKRAVPTTNTPTHRAPPAAAPCPTPHAERQRSFLAARRVGHQGTAHVGERARACAVWVRSHGPALPRVLQDRCQQTDPDEQRGSHVVGPELLDRLVFKVGPSNDRVLRAHGSAAVRAVRRVVNVRVRAQGGGFGTRGQQHAGCEHGGPRRGRFRACV